MRNYDCWKNDHTVRDCPTLSTRERDAKQNLNCLDLDDQKKTHFHAIHAKEDKGANSDEGTNK